MYDHKLHPRQLTAWLCGALIPTGIQLTAGSSWFSVCLVAVLSAICVWFQWRFGTGPRGKMTCMLWLVVMSLVLGTAAQASVLSWPTGGHPLASAMLLLLAAWSAWKGTDAAARVGSVLFWLVLLLYLVLLGAGAKQVQWQWLAPTKGEVGSMGCLLLLTPAGAAIHLKGREHFHPRLLLTVLLCTLASLITAGVLSPKAAASQTDAFYYTIRSLEHGRGIEAILSAGMTVGWFSLLSLYLTICATVFEKVKPGAGRWGIIGATVAGLTILLCQVHIPTTILLVLCAIFWVFLPVLTQWIDVEKKSKKSKNSA